jgi:hypothetical protein
VNEAMPPLPGRDPDPSPLPVATLATVLAQMADGVIVADEAGRITYVNPAARRLHGLSDAPGGDGLGVGVPDWSETYHLLTLDGQPHPPLELPLARALGGEAVTEAHWRIRRPDGTELVAQGSAVPITGPEGASAGAVLTLRDVTAEVEAHAAARPPTGPRASSSRRRATRSARPSTPSSATPSCSSSASRGRSPTSSGATWSGSASPGTTCSAWSTRCWTSRSSKPGG